MLDLKELFLDENRIFYYQNDSFSDFILNYHRAIIYEIIVNITNNNNILNKEDIGFLIDYPCKGKLTDDLYIKYYFLKDQMDKLKVKIYDDNERTNLINATWGLKEQSLEVEVMCIMKVSSFDFKKHQIYPLNFC